MTRPLVGTDRILTSTRHVSIFEKVCRRQKDTHLWPLSSRVTEVGILDHITILALYSMLKKEEVVLLVLRSLWSWFKDPKLEKKCQETSQHIPRTCTTKLVSTIYKQAHIILYIGNCKLNASQLLFSSKMAILVRIGNVMF